MFMGDSLTSGFGDTNTALMAGYRGPLMKTLAARLGFTPQFVGSNTVNSPANGWCGVSGLTVAELLATPYATDQVRQYTPDIIFLHIGTNDCTQLSSLTPGYPTLVQSRASLTALLDVIRAGSPNCEVYIARIIDNSTAHTQVVNYNAAAIDTDVVARSDYASGLIKIVDIYADVGLYSTSTYADGSHLNTTGYALEAAGWQTAFNLYH